MNNVDVLIKWRNKDGSRHSFRTNLMEADFTVEMMQETGVTNCAFNLSGTVIHHKPSLWNRLKNLVY